MTYKSMDFEFKITTVYGRYKRAPFHCFLLTIGNNVKEWTPDYYKASCYLVYIWQQR